MKKKKKQTGFNWRIAAVMTLVALTLLALCGVWYVWRVGVMPGMKIDKEQYPVTGVDLSSHNGKVDFKRLYADSVSFVYIKATEGSSFKDSKFEKNYKDATAAGGLAVGAYHFFRFDVNGTLQAKNFLSAIADKPMALPPAIDVEEHGNPDTPTAVIVERLQAMIAGLEDAGIQPVIYTNMDGYRRIYRDYFQDYPLWISRFEQPAEDVVWTIWQYSHWGDVDGTTGEVDLNVFAGTREDFLHWIGQ
ncbi:MAG: hypothetical protein K2J74_07110 [Muribaculaceae bacterium]|nr:hypothetical protein [Muribaculaceae bacterium]